MRGHYRRGVPGKDRLCGELPMRAKVVASDAAGSWWCAAWLGVSPPIAPEPEGDRCRRASVPLLSCRLPEPLSQRVRGLLRLLQPGDDLLLLQRTDGEAILAQRPHLDWRAVDPQERPRGVALPRGSG